MKSVKVLEPKNLKIVEEEIPTIINKTDVLIKIKAAGICGSDISIYNGTSPVATYPRIIGHEFTGEVIETGTGVFNVKSGDHVVINPVQACETCKVCKKGRSNVCQNLKVIGVHSDGGFREYVTVPEKNIYKIDSSILWEHAAIIEPYSVAAQVVSRGDVQQGDIVLILGSGQIAITILQVAKLLGAQCIMTDVVDERLTRAKEFGADFVINSMKDNVVDKVKELTNGVGADVAIDAACVGITLEQASLSVRPAGVVVTMGFSENYVKIGEGTITKNELDIRGSRLNNNMFPKVIEWFESGKIKPEKIITHKLHFTDVLEGFDKVKKEPETTMKVVLTFEDKCTDQ
jgi:L-gulonate 5-dehydrogenase